MDDVCEEDVNQNESSSSSSEDDNDDKLQVGPVKSRWESVDISEDKLSMKFI